MQPLALSPDTRRGIGLIAALVIAFSAVLALFAWPAANSGPRELPIAVAGPPAAVSQLRAGLERQQPGAFDIQPVGDREQAVEQIKDHEAYGALVLSDGQVETLTASARSAAVAQVLGRVGSGVAVQQHASASTVDVVPAPSADPSGSGFVSSILPLGIGSVATAAVSTLVLRRRRARALTVAGFAVLGGLSFAALQQFWLGTIDGNYLANAGIMAVTVTAIGMTVVGLDALVGKIGLGLGAVTMFLVGNALSGAASAPEMLPTGWGTLGQLLPVGAAASALRSAAFFDGNGSAGPLLVLGAWTVFGLVLLGIARLRTRGSVEPCEESAGELSLAGVR